MANEAHLLNDVSLYHVPFELLFICCVGLNASGVFFGRGLGGGKFVTMQCNKYTKGIQPLTLTSLTK